VNKNSNKNNTHIPQVVPHVKWTNFFEIKRNPRAISLMSVQPTWVSWAAETVATTSTSCSRGTKNPW